MNRKTSLVYKLTVFLLLFHSFLPDMVMVSAQEYPGIEDLFTSPTLSALREKLDPGIDSGVAPGIDSGSEGINRFYTADGGAVHLPAAALANDLLEKALAVNYSVGVESLYLIPWDKVSPDLKGLTETEFDLRIYNILRSISTLEGIEYYSASRERMRTLFEECWAVNNPDERVRIQDPAVDSVLPEDTVFIHQKDLTFGKNISRVEYQYERGQFRMGIVNLTTMTYMLFPIVKKENMSMQILIIPCREGIVFYGLSTVKVLDLPIFYKKMESSFTNRMTALYSWFLSRL